VWSLLAQGFSPCAGAGLTLTGIANGSGGVVDLVARCGGLTSCSSLGDGGKGDGGSSRRSSMVAMVGVFVYVVDGLPLGLNAATQQLSQAPRGQGARAKGKGAGARARYRGLLLQPLLRHVAACRRLASGVCCVRVFLHLLPIYIYIYIHIHIYIYIYIYTHMYIIFDFISLYCNILSI